MAVDRRKTCADCSKMSRCVYAFENTPLTCRDYIDPDDQNWGPKPMEVKPIKKKVEHKRTWLPKLERKK